MQRGMQRSRREGIETNREKSKASVESPCVSFEEMHKLSLFYKIKKNAERYSYVSHNFVWLCMPIILPNKPNFFRGGN